MMALFRFVARRGTPVSIYSDNGSNFVGAHALLRKWLSDLNQRAISDRLLPRGIQWHFNPPYASHRGGVWERLIRSFRKVLNAICTEQTPTDETLLTVFTEVERILNNRPIIPLSSDDVDSVALCPNDLLIRKNNTGVEGAGNFSDRFRANWKQAQYLAGMFWKRWRAEYLPLLQLRQRWISRFRNFKEGDVVLVASENIPKSIWPLGFVVSAHVDPDGLVRTVSVRTKDGVIIRDIRKLCLLEGAQEDLRSDSSSETDALGGRWAPGLADSRNTTKHTGTLKKCEKSRDRRSVLQVGGGPQGSLTPEIPLSI